MNCTNWNAATLHYFTAFDATENDVIRMENLPCFFFFLIKMVSSISVVLADQFGSNDQRFPSPNLDLSPDEGAIRSTISSLHSLSRSGNPSVLRNRQPPVYCAQHVLIRAVMWMAMMAPDWTRIGSVALLSACDSRSSLTYNNTADQHMHTIRTISHLFLDIWHRFPPLPIECITECWPLTLPYLHTNPSSSST